MREGAFSKLVHEMGPKMKRSMLAGLGNVCREAGIPADIKTLKVFLAGTSMGLAMCDVPMDEAKQLIEMFFKVPPEKLPNED